MKLKAYIIRTYYHDDNNCEFKTKSITCFLGEKNRQEKNFTWKYNFKTINNNNTDVQACLEQFFISLKQLQDFNYEIIFKNVEEV